MLSGTVQLSMSDVRETNSSKLHDLGTLGQGADGSLYRYAQAGGADLDPGKLTVAATQIANHENIAVQAAAAVGATEVTVTLGATAATENFYADGYLVINDAAGEGIVYRISGHPAADGSANLTVQLRDEVKVALTTSSEATLLANPWKNVVISATDQADMAVGIPEVTIATTEYGWIKTRGVVSALADETLTIGKSLTIGTGTAGAVELVDALDEPIVGIAISAGVDTEYRSIYLQID